MTNMIAKNERALRQSIIDACISMNSNGLNQGTSGNISVRFQEGILITPTSLPYDEMSAEDIV
jgi:L-fuculose-phosphate aldolase